MNPPIGYEISKDPDRLDIQMIHEYLSSQSYWARGRSLETVKTSIANSLCYGVFAPGNRQVGFARVVTDNATFAWLCDVFVLKSERGKGLGKWLIETITANPDLQSLTLFLLATKDAHQLYKKYGGFEILPSPDRWMVRVSTKTV
jgi:GNAT superfamily N-acetyltransferase